MRPAYIGARCRFARIRACVRAFVQVMWQATCGSAGNARALGARARRASARRRRAAASRPSQAMLSRARRGGVPVLSRPSAQPEPRQVAREPLGRSLARAAAAARARPVCITARRNVPVVSTTAAAEIARSRPVPLARTPAMAGPPSAPRRSAPRPWPRRTSRPPATAHRRAGRLAVAMAVRLAARRARRGALARVRASGTGCRWRRRARPIAPPSASTSRTSCPLPSPPIAGLQLISPILSSRSVTSAVRAPRRAAASAASIPACPPPTTRTS